MFSHRRHIMLVLLCGLCLCQCRPTGCQPDAPNRTERDESSWLEGAGAHSVVPESARATLFAARLSDLLGVVELADYVAGPSSRAARALWSQRFGWGFDDAESWRSLGVDVDAPGVIFYDRGWWAMVTHLAAPARFKDQRRRWVDTQTAKPASTNGAYFSGVNIDLGGRRLHVAADKEYLVAAVKVAESPSDAAAADALPAAWAPERRAILDRLEHRDLVERTARAADLVGLIRPAAWLRDVELQGQAGVLMDRVVSQLGPVAVGLERPDGGSRLMLRVLTPGERGATQVVPSLGEAEGELPPLGGLIEPGALGVVRLSASPEALYALVFSGLPAPQRTEFVAFWERLRQELRVDARADVLENLRGHAIIAIYGVKPEVVAQAPEQWFYPVLRLEATREAILLPIRDPVKMRRVLDAATTLTKNALRRQEVGETIQYAFFEDGALQWAFILGDDHILYVDSAVAFDRAMGYERSAHPLEEAVLDTGIGRLISGPDLSGIYLDVENLARLLSEAQAGRAADALRPFQRVLLTTQMVQGTGLTQIEIDLAPKDLSGVDESGE